MSTSTSSPAIPLSARDRRRWKVLVVIALGQMLMTLDATIVNVALPTIQDALDISMTTRQWVITAYTLPFAGLLLLGGRASDYLGRKRAFLIALVGFATASAVGGSAVTFGMLVVARVLQGGFAGLLAPTALSLLSTTFSDPRERGTAFAIYGAIASSGLPVGLILGGLLTEYLNWQSVLYVNVPIALTALVGAAVLIDQTPRRVGARFDVTGAILATGGLAALVYGFTTAADQGWTAPITQLMLIAGVGLLTAFVIIEARTPNPLLPLWIVTHRSRGGAFVAFLMVFAGIFGLFLLVTFYLQDIKGYSPSLTGAAFLPLAGGVIGASTIVSRLVTRVPPRLLLGVGLLLAAGGMAWLTQLLVDSGYATGVLPALIAVGLGMGTVGPVAVNLATFGVGDQHAGSASATLNTSQQVGASLGTALLNTIAAARAVDYLTSHPPSAGTRLAAQVEGYTLATTWGAAILTAAALITFILVDGHLGLPANRPVADDF